MAFRLECPCGWVRSIKDLEEGRTFVKGKSTWGCGLGPPNIVEFIPAVPECVVAVHPAVEPTKFEVQYKWPGTGWRDIVTPSLKNHTSVAAAQAALLKTGWESLQTDRANYRILETPANRVHPAFAEPPDDVEVEIRVRVPRKVYSGPYDLFVRYRFGKDDWRGVDILSTKEVTK